MSAGAETLLKSIQLPSIAYPSGVAVPSLTPSIVPLTKPCAL